MSFKTDSGGLMFHSGKISINHGSTWNTKLSQIGRNNKKIIIVTYSLPHYSTYTTKILDKRIDGENITIIAHEKFRDRATWLRDRYPKLEIILVNRVHAKLVLIEPETVWLSTENFGRSTWLEASIGIHDKSAYDYVMKELSSWYEKL